MCAAVSSGVIPISRNPEAIKYLREITSGLGRMGLSFPPEDYLVLDCETSGFAKTASILEVGYCLVRGGKLVKGPHRIAVDWSAYSPDYWGKLCFDMSKVAGSMREKTGEEWHITPEYLMRCGATPDAVFASLGALLKLCKREGISVVGHYFCRFDALRLVPAIKEFGGMSCSISPSRLVDTAAIVKGAQQAIFPNDKDRHALDYFVRTLNARSSSKFNLAHCMEMFEVESWRERLKGLHASDEDAHATHLLLERIRRIVAT